MFGFPPQIKKKTEKKKKKRGKKNRDRNMLR